MKYEDLVAAARELPAQQRDATLRQLVNDPRFAAVLALILEQKDLAADSSARLDFANNHGCLAHAGGVRYGMLELENRLRTACAPRKPKPPTPAEA